MQKFIISVKGKSTGCDVVSPYIVNSLDGLGIDQTVFQNQIAYPNRGQYMCIAVIHSASLLNCVGVLG